VTIVVFADTSGPFVDRSLREHAVATHESASARRTIERLTHGILFDNRRSLQGPRHQANDL
jgi:hypothetical protein